MSICTGEKQMRNQTENTLFSHNFLYVFDTFPVPSPPLTRSGSDSFSAKRFPTPHGLLGGARVLRDNEPAKVEMRARILQLHHDDPSLSQRQIAAQLRAPRSNVVRVLRSGVATVRQRGGIRRFAITAPSKQRFIRLVTGTVVDGWRTGGMGLRAAVRRWNASDDEKESISLTSAQRWLHEAKFFAYVPLVGGNIQVPNEAQRRAWYERNHRHNPTWWYQLCFSDSTQVYYYHSPIARNERVWGRRGDKIRRLRKRRPRKTLHTYGVLTQYGMVGPFFVRDTVTAHKYIRNILPKMLAGIREIYAANGDEGSWIFMQDGAGPHTANRTQKWLERSGINYWDKRMWPGCSPDLNPVEGFWAILQEHVTPIGQDQNLPDAVVEQRVEQWFQARQKPACRKALRGMPHRCQQLLEAEFHAIGH